MNPPSNINTGATSNPPPRTGLPFLGQIQDPSARSTFNPASTSPNNPQPSMGGFPPGMNLNQSGPPPSGGFPPGMNRNQSGPPPTGGFPPGMNPNQSGPPPTNNPQSPMVGFPSWHESQSTRCTTDK